MPLPSSRCCKNMLMLHTRADHKCPTRKCSFHKIRNFQKNPQAQIISSIWQIFFTGQCFTMLFRHKAPLPDEYSTSLTKDVISWLNWKEHEPEQFARTSFTTTTTWRQKRALLWSWEGSRGVFYSQIYLIELQSDPGRHSCREHPECARVEHSQTSGYSAAVSLQIQVQGLLRLIFGNAEHSFGSCTTSLAQCLKDPISYLAGTHSSSQLLLCSYPLKTLLAMPQFFPLHLGNKFIMFKACKTN